MKNLKPLGFVAVAAIALLASASSASASKLYNGATPLAVGATLDFSIPSGGSANLVDTSGTSLDKCSTSTIKSTLSENSPGITGSITEMTWGSCSFPTKTTVPGKMKIDWITSTIGTVTTDAEISITINTVLFGSCVYSAKSSAHIGTLTTFASGPSIMDLNEIVVKGEGGASCPETAKWTGSYTGTEPANLRVEEK